MPFRIRGNGDLVFKKGTYEGEDYNKDIAETVEGGNGISSVEAGKKIRVEITDENGNRIIDNTFNNVESTNKNNILKYTLENGTYGLFNLDGKILTSREYNEIGNFGENGFAVVQEATEDSLYGYINEEGEEVLSCIYEFAGEFADNGLACIGMKIGEDVKYGYIDEKGEEIISLQYDYANSFSDNGLALVENAGKYGYIDKDGNKVIDFQYDDAGSFGEDDFVYVGKENVKGKTIRGFINDKGEWNKARSYKQLYKYGELMSDDKDIDNIWIGIYDDYGSYDLIRDGKVIATGVDIPVISGDKVIVATKKEDEKIYFGIQNLDGTWFIKPNENSWMKDVLQEERDTWYTPAE